MGCERRRPVLSRLAAGEGGSAELLAHLEGCAGCRGTLAAMRRALDGTDAELAALAGREPGPGFEERVLEAARESRDRPFPLWWRWAAAAAVGLVVVGVLAREAREPTERAGPSGPELPRPVAEAPAALPATREADPSAARSGVSPTPAPRAVAARGAERPSARSAPTDRGRPREEVRVPAGQLQAIVHYARLRSRHQAGWVMPADEPPVAIATEPIRIEALSIEPLSFGAEGARR